MPTQLATVRHDAVVISKDHDARFVVPGILGGAAILTLAAVVFGFHSSNPQTKSPEFIGAGVLMEAILLPLAIWAAGPCELHLDPKNRRYRFLSGLPLLARTVEGPYTDIAAMIIRPSDNRTPGNKLEIEWAVAGRKTVYVRQLTLEQSYAMQNTIQNKAGLPLVWKT